MNAPFKVAKSAEPAVLVLKSPAKKPGLIDLNPQFPEPHVERWPLWRSVLAVFFVCCVLWAPIVFAFVKSGGAQWFGLGFAWIGHVCADAWRAIF